MYEENRCGLCSRGEEEHRQLEASGQINHRYNEAGKLEQIDRSTPRRQQPQVPTVVGAIDIDLRRILLKKGIISNEDFAALHQPRPGTAGDREAGPTESSG